MSIHSDEFFLCVYKDLDRILGLNSKDCLFEKKFLELETQKQQAILAMSIAQYEYVTVPWKTVTSATN
jgi:hypothetical protein